MTPRKLSLKRESLTELTGAQLMDVVGAEATGACTGGCTADSRLKCDLSLQGPPCFHH